MFNVLNGDKVAVDGLLTHPDVQSISFVGSTPIARYVYETGTTHGKRVQALGGAKNHLLVLPAADLDLAADQAVNAGYGSAGGGCMAISAVLAIGDIGDELVAKIKERTVGLRTGDGTPAAIWGRSCLSGSGACVRLYRRWRGGRATLVVDGRKPKSTPMATVLRGPTLFDHVPRHEHLHRRDLRAGARGGSSGQLRRRREADQRQPYGNGQRSSPLTEALPGSSRTRSRSADFGINVPVPVPMAYYSFGGWKNSLSATPTPTRRRACTSSPAAR